MRLKKIKKQELIKNTGEGEKLVITEQEKLRDAAGAGEKPWKTEIQKQTSKADKKKGEFAWMTSIQWSSNEQRNSDIIYIERNYWKMHCNAFQDRITPRNRKLMTTVAVMLKLSSSAAL